MIILDDDAFDKTKDQKKILSASSVRRRVRTSSLSHLCHRFPLVNPSFFISHFFILFRTYVGYFLRILYVTGTVPYLLLVFEFVPYGTVPYHNRVQISFELL